MRPFSRRSHEPMLSLILVLVLLSASAVTANALTDEERLALRRQARQDFLASGHHTDSVVVDGTPRLADGAVEELAGLGSDGQGAEPAGYSHRRFDPETEGMSKSLTTQIGEAGMRPPLGGDDVIIASGAQYDSSPLICIASDGTHFVAITALGQVEIWKSTDFGETWSLWSTVADPSSSIPWLGDMELAEGDADRLFLAWVQSGSGRDLQIAYADPGAAVPVWTVVTALSDPGVLFSNGQRLDIHTDVAVFSDYFVYVTVLGDDGDGDDIWFTRSVNMGNSYESGYKIADSATSTYTEFDVPVLSAGNGSFVHASYLARGAGGVNRDLLHRRAGDWGNSGMASWEAEQVVNLEAGGPYSVPVAMTASFTEGLVVVTSIQFGGIVKNLVYYSTDNGATWPAANEVTTGLTIGSTQPLILPSGEIVLGSAENESPYLENSMVLARSTTADPSTWTPPEALSISSYSFADQKRFDGIAADPLHGHRVAAVWVIGLDGNKTLRFDAEWRRDAGFGNTEVGFPISVAGGGQSPPAIAEIDGDPFKEIVFGTSTGDIHVLNHDGTPVPGWPVNIGSIPLDAPVAIGRIAYDGYRKIVAGNGSGQVFAFHSDGTMMAGFPVQMNQATDVFVSIGPLGTSNARVIVAACGMELRAIGPDGGTVNDPVWGTFTTPMTRPAAIGDVDNDGDVEVVTLNDEYLHILAMGMQGNEVFRYFPGVSFSDAPTLADFDGDGDLEIAAPTTDGRMYLMHHDGTDVAGWPFTVASGQALTSAAIADIIGNDVLEMSFAERDGSGLLHQVLFNGVEHMFFPQSFGTDLLYMPPIVEKSSVGATHITLMTPGGIGHNWSNLGVIPDGWPRNLSGAVEETPAGGDIDNDGRTEIVILGVDFITVLDIGEPPFSHLNARWPMYGFDAERTGCFECFGDAPSAVEDTPPPLRSPLALEVYPNPFNPLTTINYEVKGSGPVTLEVFDIRGRLMDVILRGVVQSEGPHTLRYEPDLASGVYFLRLESGGEIATRKIGLLK